MSRPTAPITEVLPSVGLAMARAARSQLHPSMLLAMFLPFIAMMLGALLLGWLFWQPLQQLIASLLTDTAWVAQVDAWLLSVGIASLVLWVAPVGALFVLLPLSAMLGLAVAAIVVMPWVMRHLRQGRYADLDWRGRFVLPGSLWNSTWVLVVFIAGWILTLPLWLIPPLALVLPTLWWTFLFTHLLRYDAVADAATVPERRELLRRHRLGFWTLGLVCALLSLLPPAWLVLPVYSSLLFAHFGLQALRELRAATTVLPPATPLPGISQDLTSS